MQVRRSREIIQIESKVIVQEIGIDITEAGRIGPANTETGDPKSQFGREPAHSVTCEQTQWMPDQETCGLFDGDEFTRPFRPHRSVKRPNPGYPIRSFKTMLPGKPH